MPGDKRRIRLTGRRASSFKRVYANIRRHWISMRRHLSSILRAGASDDTVPLALLLSPALCMVAAPAARLPPAFRIFTNAYSATPLPTALRLLLPLHYAPAQGLLKGGGRNTYHALPMPHTACHHQPHKTASCDKTTHLQLWPCMPHGILLAVQYIHAFCFAPSFFLHGSSSSHGFQLFLPPLAFHHS